MLASLYVPGVPELLGVLCFITHTQEETEHKQQTNSSYTGFPCSCNNTVQTNLRTRKITKVKFDSPQP